ncbi:hypothetical protein D1006_36575 [Burkholderia stabilis]|uniref:Uncharacterized protein n=1 Tax=Burkholderia stabilis TaxID=95485 RepID=A0A4Q2A9Q0_9BURK|nr:hypothetical protein D1006_36575 [Burkholderia stabilis]
MPGEQARRPGGIDARADGSAGRRRRTRHYNVIHIYCPPYYNPPLPAVHRTCRLFHRDCRQVQAKWHAPVTRSAPRTDPDDPSRGYPTSWQPLCTLKSAPRGTATAAAPHETQPSKRHAASKATS